MDAFTPLGTLFDVVTMGYFTVFYDDGGYRDN